MQFKVHSGTTLGALQRRDTLHCQINIQRFNLKRIGPFNALEAMAFFLHPLCSFLTSEFIS